MALEVTVQKLLRSGIEPFELSVNFKLQDGITVLFGPSGSGKTTTLNLIAGITTPDRGSIILSDETLFDSERKINLPMRRRRIGYLFQDLALFPHLTVLDNIEFGIPGTRNNGREAARAWLERFGLTELALRRPATLSGGQQQRVALLRALASEPR